MVEQLDVRMKVCLDELDDWLEAPGAPPNRERLGDAGRHRRHPQAAEGMLTSRSNLETMTPLTLMRYPFSGRPAYLALAPLTHAAGVLCSR